MRPLFRLVIALAGCRSTLGIPFPSDAVRFTPPSIYREWWSLTEQCSGRHVSFDAVSWYLVPDSRTLPGTSELNGAWYATGNRVVLSGADDGVAAGDLVRHEMLHAILGTGSHPRDMFVARCGGVVTCIEECLRAGSAPQNPTADPAPPEALEVTVSVMPHAPSSAVWDGFLMMVVSARNPSDYPVMIQVPESGADSGHPPLFSFDVHEARGEEMSYDMRIDAPEARQFAAGETKHFIFDFHNVRGPYRYDLPPGTWTFKGAYAGVWGSNPPTTVISP